MYELLISNKKTGEIWSVASLADGALEFSTERQGSPGQLTFSLVMKGDLTFNEGDIVRFSVDGKLVFYGYVFTKETDRWGVCSVTCYDRLRYLKANASYAFYGRSAGDIIKEIAADMQIDVGSIDDTRYKIPSIIESNQSCIDIINKALSQTLLATGELFTLYDNGTGLSLKYVGDWASDVVLGDKSYITDYVYTTDIDRNVYNSVKLVQQNENTGRADVVVAQDSGNISLWGKLQLYQEIDGNLNTAQMAEKAKEMLSYYNKVRKTVTLSSVGVPGVRAGMMIRVMIPQFTGWTLIESCSHTYENDMHTMELEVYELT